MAYDKANPGYLEFFGRQFADNAASQMPRAMGWGGMPQLPTANTGGGGGGGGRNRGYGRSRDNYGIRRPNLNGDRPPDPFRSPQHRQALNDYLDWTKWKKRELKDLIAKYRTELPKQIDAYKEAQYAGLPEQKKALWGQMHTNLQQRGLDDSGSFLGGAKQEHNQWVTQQKQGIEDAAEAMRQQGQQAMLAAIGQPNYGANYGNWANYDQALNDYWFNQWLGNKENK